MKVAAQALGLQHRLIVDGAGQTIDSLTRVFWVVYFAYTQSQAHSWDLLESHALHASSVTCRSDGP
jgi:hypothetical protein